MKLIDSLKQFTHLSDKLKEDKDLFLFFHQSSQEGAAQIEGGLDYESAVFLIHEIVKLHKINPIDVIKALGGQVIDLTENKVNPQDVN